MWPLESMERVSHSSNFNSVITLGHFLEMAREGQGDSTIVEAGGRRSSPFMMLS